MIVGGTRHCGDSAAPLKIRCPFMNRTNRERGLEPYTWEIWICRQRHLLLLCLKFSELESEITSQNSTETPSSSATATADVPARIFLVHGHNEAIRLKLEKFLERLEIDTIVLFNEPGRGQTIIEKLEANSEVKHAIVLLTGDDEGRSVSSQDELQPRARQNVVLELGYFLGLLGRSCVTVLYESGVEIPSDYRGVEYIRLDSADGWRLQVAKELRAADFDIDLNRVL